MVFLKVWNLKKYRKQIYGVLILFIVAVLQATLLNYFRIFNIKPDVILIALIVLVPFFSLRWSVIFAFLSGVFRDIFSSLPFGINVILCIIWVIVAKEISRRLSIEHKLVRSAIPCLIILLNNLALRSFLFALQKPIIIYTFLKIVFLECIFALLLILPMYRFFVYIFKDSISSQSF